MMVRLVLANSDKSKTYSWSFVDIHIKSISNIMLANN
jgi:hypothetical protein